MKSRDSHAQKILVRLQSAVCKGIKEKVQGSFTLSMWVYQVSHKSVLLNCLDLLIYSFLFFFIFLLFSLPFFFPFFEAIIL